VHASDWRQDIEKLVGDLRPEIRSRIILVRPSGVMEEVAVPSQ
jgi:hypothetical protein